MRLFAAVRPPVPVLDHLESSLGVVRAAAGPGPGALRWTPPEDRHLTAAFYGSVPDGLLPELTADLDAACAGLRPFRLALRGAGLFDHRTLWAGVTGDVDAMAGLMAAAVRVGEDLLGRSDDRVRSRAHLTVARVRPTARGRTTPRRGVRDGRKPGDRPGPDVAADLVSALSVYEGPAWTVDSLELVRSELGAGEGGAPRHEVVARLRLGPVAG